MRYGNPQPEAPTHLGSHQLPLPPEWLSADELDADADDDGPTRARAGWTPAPAHDISISGPTRQATERSASPLLLDSRRIERPHPDDLRREARRSVVASGEVETSARLRVSGESRGSSRADDRAHRSSTPRIADDRDARRSKSDDRDAPRSKSDDRDARRSSSGDRSASSSGTTPASASASVPSASRPSQPSVSGGSQPELDVAALEAQQAAAMAAIGAIDPMAVPVPPELGGPIYGWIRRLALQADLLGADKVLREAFVDLTSSLSVAIVYPGADGLWTLGQDDEIPKDATPLVAVAQARRAVISSHTALIPVVTSTETVAVVLLTRNPRNPAYHPIEQVAMVALARECAAILHHLAVAHLQKASEIKADQGGLYRGEALEAHRSRGNEGVPVNLSPGWVKRAYPLLVVTILIALFASIFVTVPTYSSGVGVVEMPNTAVAAPMGGTVEQVLVEPGQHVKKGTALVRLHAAEQDAELHSAQTDADNATTLYLFDQQDEQVKKTLAAALVRVERERARVDSRIIRASADGTVSDIRVRVGSSLTPGDLVLQILEPGAEPEVWVFLPGKDRPRLRLEQELQTEIVGYTKSRDKAKITYISPEAFGPTEVAKIVGVSLADSVKLAPGSYVWVKAKLPAKAFKTQHQTFWYHHGMPVKAEVKIQSKPFLVTLLPALEKYIPD